MDSLATADSWGAGPANHSPFRFTEDSLISVPVMKVEDTSTTASQAHSSSDSRQPPTTPKFLSLKFGRKSSTSKTGSEDFTMRRIPRREYLAHYAKDESGRYVGTAEPADDCILRGEDLAKHRGSKHLSKFENEFARESDPAQTAMPNESVVVEAKSKKRLFGGRKEKDVGDGVIR